MPLYLSVLISAGSSTNSVNGLVSKISENSSDEAPQFDIVGCTFKYIRNACWILSAVSRISKHRPDAVRDRKSSINRTPILYPIRSSCLLTSSMFSKSRIICVTNAPYVSVNSSEFWNKQKIYQWMSVSNPSQWCYFLSRKVVDIEKLRNLNALRTLCRIRKISYRHMCFLFCIKERL